MQIAKDNITFVVSGYMKLFPDEFRYFKEGIRVKQDSQNTKFAEVPHGDFVNRALYDIPETLFILLKAKLSPEEFTWYESKEGARWFAQNFPLFRLGEKV